MSLSVNSNSYITLCPHLSFYAPVSLLLFVNVAHVIKKELSESTKSIFIFVRINDILVNNYATLQLSDSFFFLQWRAQLIKIYCHCFTATAGTKHKKVFVMPLGIIKLFVEKNLIRHNYRKSSISNEKKKYL